MTRPIEPETGEASRPRPGPQPPGPGLHLVATPIGNLRDITLRALDVLAGADHVFAEDTRVTRKLLDAYGLKPRLDAYHDHNAARMRPKILDALARGESVALVSDAGTPLVSDPGYKLARAAIEAGYAVHAVPGASSVLTALLVSGLPADRFLFAGFPSAKAGARTAALRDLASVPASLVFFESARRLAASLAAMAACFGPRPAAVSREMTKKFEETRRGDLAALAAHYAEVGPPKGEVVIVVGPPEAGAEDWDDAAVDAALVRALPESGVKAASAAIAEASGRPRRDIYARALALKDGV